MFLKKGNKRLVGGDGSEDMPGFPQSWTGFPAIVEMTLPCNSMHGHGALLSRRPIERTHVRRRAKAQLKATARTRQGVARPAILRFPV